MSTATRKRRRGKSRPRKKSAATAPSTARSPDGGGNAAASSTGGLVAVIGAGPSGLVAAKTLLENGFGVAVFEAGAQIGGTFRYKSYDGGRLVSSCLLTAFSDFRMRDCDADHPSIPQYLRYLEAYCDAFGLWSKIRFHSAVSLIERSVAAPGSYTVHVESTSSSSSSSSSSTTTTAYSEKFDAICISSGLHNVPAIPHVANLDAFAGSHFHSAAYKKRGIFRNKRVLVVGSGETGLDIAYRAADARAREVTLVSRSGFLSVPHDFADGVPLDSFITNLFESCYQHPWVEALKLKWTFTSLPIRAGFLLSSGSSNGFNQWAGAREDVRRGKYIINKSVRAMPYINRPVKRRYWCRAIGRFFFWLYDAHLCDEDKPDIDVVQCTPVSVVDANAQEKKMTKKTRKKTRKKTTKASTSGSTVVFSDGSARTVDTIVWCTGYRQKFPFLKGRPARRDGVRGGASDETATAESPTLSPELEHDRRDEVDDGADDALPSEHNIVDPAEPNLAFIGFVRPNVGAIPPMSELQVQWWIQKMRGRLQKQPASAATPASYRLLGYGTTANRTSEYAVDFGAYCHELAREIGSAPDLLHLAWQSPKAAIGYALGQAYTTHFRINGPFAMEDDEALRISAGELFDPVWRRPILSNVVFVAVILLFALINGAALLVDVVLCRPLLVVWDGVCARARVASVSSSPSPKRSVAQSPILLFAVSLITITLLLFSGTVAESSGGGRGSGRGSDDGSGSEFRTGPDGDDLGCTFSPETVLQLERWWNGGELHNINIGALNLACVAREASQFAGGVAGGLAGSQVGSGIGEYIGGLLGGENWKDIGAHMGRLGGWMYGQKAGARLANAVFDTLTLAYFDKEWGSKTDDANNRGGYSAGANASQKERFRRKCYALLGVHAGSDRSEIRSAFRKAARSAHPDKEGGSEAKMVELNLCREIVLLANTGRSSNGNA